MIIALILVLWLLGWACLWRVPTCQAATRPRACPPVSVIIPARNEAANLPRLLASIRAQEAPPAEVIVVDDASSDGTADVARRLGATVVTAPPLPTGWRGKTWACHQGAAAARGAVLLFLDADTFFAPDGWCRMADTFADGSGALSIGPYHVVQQPYEQLSAYFNLLMTIGMGTFTMIGRRVPPAGLFGPCLMIRREDYARSGGHAAVKGAVLENFFLAQRLTAVGVPLRCLGGRSVLAMRMYPDGLADLVRGWSKAFAGGAAHTRPALLCASSAWIAGAVTAVVLLVLHPGVSSAAAYGLFAAQAYAMLRQIGSFTPAAALAYPLPLLFFLAVFTRAAARAAASRPVVWKGRAFRDDPGPGTGATPC